jgi:hypothetical protein
LVEQAEDVQLAVQRPSGLTARFGTAEASMLRGLSALIAVG